MVTQEIYFVFALVLLFAQIQPERFLFYLWQEMFYVCKILKSLDLM